MQTQANKAGTIHGTTSAVAAILPSGGGGATPPSPRLLYYYHPDYLGNVECITDADGLPYQYFFYSPWGEPLKEQTGPNYANWESPYTFNGKELDEETGLYYYGARYFNPQVSVWLSVDAMAHWYPSMSPYNFSANNPVMLVDPNGQWVEGAGFFRNLFNRDEKILAQDEATKHKGGEAFKIEGGWRATWSEGEMKIKDDHVEFSETVMQDFYRGENKSGRAVYSSFVGMMDRKFEKWQNENMRGGGSAYSRTAYYLDKEIGSKLLKTTLDYVPNPSTAINSVKTISTGVDLYGNSQEGFVDRYLFPSAAIFSGPLKKPLGFMFRNFKNVKKVQNSVDLINEVGKAKNTYETWR